MKAINIIGIPATVVVFILSFYYMEETRSARWAYWDYMYPYDGSTPSYGFYGQSPEALTREGGLVLLLFTLFFIWVNIGNLVKVKTMTTKVLSIIGMSLNGIVFIVNALMIAFAHDMNLDESTGPLWIIFAPIMLAFSIVYLVQSTRKPGVHKSRNDTLDDIINEVI